LDKIPSVEESQLKTKEKTLGVKKNQEELAILRWLYRFPETVEQTAKQYNPNLICNYLYELAQRFNVFYNQHRILPSSSYKGLSLLEETKLRLMLVQATAQIIKNGLYLLGIKTVEKM
jgi:arginyl-tRNA synthetase